VHWDYAIFVVVHLLSPVPKANRISTVGAWDFDGKDSHLELPERSGHYAYLYTFQSTA
jgi:hypothetical protein